jgi:HD-GYP domain-containing protein (c-di-GMP phosphodiesterase class II)
MAGDATVGKLTALLEIGKALSAERDLGRLLALILREATRVLEADRSSCFLVDRERGDLWTRVAEGVAGEIRIPLSTGIAGHVARTGQLLHIPDAYADPRFNPDADQQTGYRTRNLLCAPMRNQAGEVIGVLEVLNKQQGAFADGDGEILLALAGQAGVAVENALLYGQIEGLLEGFMRASAYAIDARDPATAGHSERVTCLTLGLVEAVNAAATGPYAGVRFTPRAMREIRYACLLHDFGKVGVREYVLLKGTRLSPPEMEAIRLRLGLLREREAAACAEAKAMAIAELGAAGARQRIAELEGGLAERRRAIDEATALIEALNDPSRDVPDGPDRLAALAGWTMPGPAGRPAPLLTPYEVESLSVRRGTLTPGERAEIEAHVSHSYEFLRQIPWTRDLARVPEIAWGHHEREDGRGYPRGLTGDRIPLPAKMMAIADMYDALTAMDRPYRRALAPARAIEILAAEARHGALDPELVRLFIEARVYEVGRETGK